jgi:type IV pilus assembly protein PilP
MMKSFPHINSVTRSLRCLLISFLLISLVACVNQDISDLNEYIVKIKSRQKGKIEPLPEIKIVEPFIFNPDGLRDPFRPIERMNEQSNVEMASTKGIRPDTTRRKEELELYSLDSLRMVGTLSMKSGLWALVKASDGTIHRVRAGNYMGRNYGKIIRILQGRIELMEIVSDQPGTWREQQASLALAV